MSSKSFDNATREWVQIRKKLYLQIRSEVHRLLAASQTEFIPLETQYAKELAQPWRAVNKEDLYDSFAQADIVLLGDFHALQQSQRGHLRVLRDWPKPSGLVLAVEFFQARHQKVLEDYLAGRLPEETFLAKIAWEKSWGFPWEHYKPIVEWARKNRVPLVGINWGLKQTNMRSIKTRENFSAMCLRKLHAKYPKQKIVVIYGDLHLAKLQLPAAIKKHSCFRRSKILRIFQNDEDLYFKALVRGLENKIEVIQLRSGDLCVQAVPPWVKWQSYLLFLENAYDRQIDEMDGDLDPTDHVAKLVAFLSAEFRVKLKGTGLAVYTADDTQVYTKIRRELGTKEWSGVQKLITGQRSFYLPELQIGYLGRVTVNHAANLAAEYVHSLLSKRRRLYMSGLADFERQIWIQAMAYLGSKVINHNRKTSSLEDLRKSLLQADERGANRKILLLALHQKVREIRFLTDGRLIRSHHIRGGDSLYVDSARLLGGMLGEKIYSLYRSRKWPLERLKQVLQLSLESSEFRAKYYSALKSIAQHD